LIFYFAFCESLLLKGIPTGARDFFVLQSVRLVLGLTPPAIQCIKAILSQAVKQFGHKANH